jgi:rSAM/selenodomain-associated transferase 1
MKNVAIGILCKTPAPGLSKTRLSPPLDPGDCAAISSCFIRDLARTIADLAQVAEITPYAVYTPVGSEAALRQLLPPSFNLLPQCDGDFGLRLQTGLSDLLGLGHRGAILVNSDSPTLPAGILRAAALALDGADKVVLSPAVDGGYTLIGISRLHPHLFAGVPWSTAAVHATTLRRAAEIALPAVEVPGWYDVDDSASFAMLERELLGGGPGPDGATQGAPAAATHAFLVARQQALQGAAE